MAAYNWGNSVQVGPWGAQGGYVFHYKPNGGITEIIITYADDEIIHSISFKSVDANGKVDSSEKFGGTEGTGKLEKIIKINWPNEYLTSLSWTQASYKGFEVIQSICFLTNQNKYGPFGPTSGTPYNYSMEGGVIVGFHGRKGYYVDSIGFYVKSFGDLFGRAPSLVQIFNPKVNDGLMTNFGEPRELGLWGGKAGKPWDDGVFSAIKQVDVHVGNGIVRALLVHYQSKSGKSVESKRHGGEGGGTIYRIKLDGSSEYLVGIMGTYGPIEENGGFEAVRSISFYTNKGKYGPFGNEIGIYFNSPLSKGKVTGFHGRSNVYLDAVGVHIEYS